MIWEDELGHFRNQIMSWHPRILHTLPHPGNKGYFAEGHSLPHSRWFVPSSWGLLKLDGNVILSFPKIPGAAKTMKNKGHELQPSFSRFWDGKPGFWQVALKPCFQDLFIFHAQRCLPKFCGFLWMFVWIDLVGLSSYLYVVLDACSFNLSWFTSSCPSTHVHIHLTGFYHITTLWRTKIWQQSSPTDVSQITSLFEGVL